MDTLLREPLTTESFLAWEDGQEGKHEFDGTCVIEMTGGSYAHQRIVINLVMLLLGRLPPELSVIQEMRIRIGAKVRYPDVCVFSGHVPPTRRTLTEAVTVVEVLSDDTATTDRAVKLDEYAGIAGIRYYVLVEQDRVGLTVHRRRDGSWETSTVASGALSLPDLDVDLPIHAIYAGLRLPQSRT